MVNKRRLSVIAGAVTVAVGLVGLFIRLKRNKKEITAKDL